MQVNTVAGPVDVGRLGKVLMHEHLLIGIPGWESDTTCPRQPFAEMVAQCVDRIEELKSNGFSTLLDPCPNDLGRDISLMAEVADRTGFNIVFATGLYNQHLGGAPYWILKLLLDPDAEERLADLFITELTQGVGGSGIKAGVIKVGTSTPPITDYERIVFRAAAKASIATGAPITTHTDAVLGDEQLALLTSLGVPAHKIIIGHSCGSADHDYHMKIVDGGAYIGFDRFGLEAIQSDSVRTDSLLKLFTRGRSAQVVISHDSVWCRRGVIRPAALLEQMAKTTHELRFTRSITPMLLGAGITSAQIDGLLIDNPRRYFSGAALPPCKTRA